MNKMQKLTCAKVFKVIFYLLGFPLLLLLVAKDSMVFFDEDVFSQAAKDGINAIAILWASFTLIQIGLYLVMKKQQALRTVILVALAIVMMLAPISGLDKYASGKVADADAKYTEHGAKVNDYSLQKQWFNTLSDKKSYTDTFMENLNEFIRVYGLDGYDPLMYRARTQLNTVPYFVTDSGNGETIKITDDKGTDLFDKLVADGKNPVAYNPNGTLYDGYIYGVDYAVNLLIEYNEFKSSASTTRVVGKIDTMADGTISVATAVSSKYKVKDTDGVLRKYTGPANFTTDPTDTSKIHFDGTFYEVLTIDQALKKAVETARTTQAWVDYSTSEDYVAKKAAADDYVLDADRLNDVLSVLLEYLGMNPDLNQLAASLAKIIDVLPTLGLLGTAEETEVILAGLRYPAYYLFGETLIELNTSKGEDTAYANYKSAMILAEDERASANGEKARYHIAALTDLLKGLGPVLPVIGGLLTGTVKDALTGLVPIDLSLLGLTEEKLNNLVTQILNLALAPATGVDLSALTTQGVENLLMTILSEISYYHHPDLKYDWQFISGDDTALITDNGKTVDLSRYAWVKYTCENWGITNGCALATKSGGLLTGKTLGSGASADDAFNLTELYQLRADLDYAPAVYPLFAARRYMSMWAGVLAISIFMYTYFYNKERKFGYEVLLAGGEY